MLFHQVHGKTEIETGVDSNFVRRPRQSWACAMVAVVLCGLAGVVHGQQRRQENTAPPATANNPNVSAGFSTGTLNLDEKIARMHKTANWRFVDKQFIETIEKRKSELQGIPVTVEGVIRNGRNQPVADAFVILRLVSNVSNLTLFNGKAKDVFAITWSDNAGEFKFTNHPTPWFEPTHPLGWELCIFAPGYAMETRPYRYVDSELRHEKIELQPEQVVEGTVKEPDGKPITNCGFALAEIVNPFDNAEIDYSLLQSEMKFFVQPDGQGRFRIGGLPPDRIATLQERQGTRLVRPIRIATSADLDPKKMISKDSPRSRLVYPYFSPNFEIVTYGIADNSVSSTNSQASKTAVTPQPTRTVTVRVVNAQDGAGVSGVAVNWQRAVKELRISPGMLVTDEKGIAKLEISQDAVDVFIGGRRFGFITPYNRITTDPNEYTPPVERSSWVQAIGAGQDDIAVTFELQPVPPLQIRVQKQDGTPVAAELRISRQDWIGCEMPKVYSNENGLAAIAIRPVMFEIEITATTKDGLKSKQRVTLSKTLNELESVTVTVR